MKDHIQQLVDFALGNTWYMPPMTDPARKTIRLLPDGREACGDRGGPVKSCAVPDDEPGEVRSVNFDDLDPDDQAEIMAILRQGRTR